jgi:hypothetical protein
MLPKPEDKEAKEKFKKNEVKAKRILADSIKDHMIPNVSELKTPKEMFDALTRLYESKNTSPKLTLRHQLRNVTMNKLETVVNYFMKISQIKDQLATIGDSVEDVELVTTTPNGFPPSWDPFVQGICARRKLPKFDKLWSNCTQEESRLISKTQKTNEDENQALAAQVKKRKKREEGSLKKSKRPCYKKDASNIRCYSCQKLGHYAFQSGLLEAPPPPPGSSLGSSLGASSLRKLGRKRAFEIQKHASGFRKLALGFKNTLPAHEEVVDIMVAVGGIYLHV